MPWGSHLLPSPFFRLRSAVLQLSFSWLKGAAPDNASPGGNPWDVSRALPFRRLAGDGDVSRGSRAPSAGCSRGSGRFSLRRKEGHCTGGVPGPAVAGWLVCLSQEPVPVASAQIQLSSPNARARTAVLRQQTRSRNSCKIKVDTGHCNKSYRGELKSVRIIQKI